MFAIKKLTLVISMANSREKLGLKIATKLY